MPYLVLKSCIAAGSRRTAGDVIELSKDEASALLAVGRVEAAPEFKAFEKTDRSVGLQASKASPLKKRGKKNAD